MMKPIDLYCAVAGALDTVTGLLLVAAPTVTVGWIDRAKGMAQLRTYEYLVEWDQKSVPVDGSGEYERKGGVYRVPAGHRLRTR